MKALKFFMHNSCVYITLVNSSLFAEF